jgi:hypothetical protein
MNRNAREEHRVRIIRLFPAHLQLPVGISRSRQGNSQASFVSTGPSSAVLLHHEDSGTLRATV